MGQQMVQRLTWASAIGAAGAVVVLGGMAAATNAGAQTSTDSLAAQTSSAATSSGTQATDTLTPGGSFTYSSSGTIHAVSGGSR